MTLVEYTGDSMVFYAAMAEDNLQHEIAERTAERKQLAETEPSDITKVEEGMASSAARSTVVITRSQQGHTRAV